VSFFEHGCYGTTFFLPKFILGSLLPCVVDLYKTSPAVVDDAFPLRHAPKAIPVTFRKGITPCLPFEQMA
jgi:hypothetical protein